MNKIDLNIINWVKIQESHNNGDSLNILISKFNISRKILERARAEGFFKYEKTNVKMLNEQKNNIRNGRIKFLKENPEKHPWKQKNKKKSVPCELLKEILIKNELVFQPEYTPVESDRFYSIDIAFIKNKIGVEVNGNQHYNKDGTLKKYYLDRNNHFKSLGWIIIELQYLKVYDNKIINDLILYLKGVEDYSFDELTKFMSVIIKEKNKTDNCKCGIIKLKKSKNCNNCNSINNRKVIRPSKIELEDMIKTNSWTKIGKYFSVSDNAVRKWAKSYGLI